MNMTSILKYLGDCTYCLKVKVWECKRYFKKRCGLKLMIYCILYCGVIDRIDETSFALKIG